MWNLLAPLLGKALDAILPDPKAAADAKIKLLELQQAGALAELDAELKSALAQIAVNQEEAKSTNWFIAGWRPAVGWVCALGLAYVALFEPVARFIASVLFDYRGAFPVIDTSLTMQVLLGMLGLAGMRTFEKHKDAEGKR